MTRLSVQILTYHIDIVIVVLRSFFEHHERLLLFLCGGSGAQFGLNTAMVVMTRGALVQKALV